MSTPQKLQEDGDDVFPIQVFGNFFFFFLVAWCFKEYFKNGLNI